MNVCQIRISTHVTVWDLDVSGIKVYPHHEIAVINVRDIIRFTNGQNEATGKNKSRKIGHQNKEFSR
jgi:hypothetical protein